MSGVRPSEVAYELTVVGCLGPVLIRALEPWVTASSQQEFVLRARVREDGDVTDLVGLLVQRGLEVNYLGS